MHNLDDVTRLPDDFDGRVRLFPLPQLVLFPHAMQPLHIFEPRYCEMLTESLEGDRLIAMATLKEQGQAKGGAQQSPIAQTVCLGKIISHAQVEEDRHNILLVGTRRGQIIQEIDAGRPFRIAEIQITEDVYPPVGSEGRSELKKNLLRAFQEVIPVSQSVQQNLHELMAGELSLGPITDIIAYTLPFDTDEKLKLLSDADVDARARRLVGLLESGAIHFDVADLSEASDDEDGQSFPPPFSLN